MANDTDNTAWRFYHRYTFVFLILLFAVGLGAVFVGVYVIPNQKLSAVALGVGTSFLASVIFATLSRYFIEKEFEELVVVTIGKAFESESQKILQKIDLKVDHLQKFMPSEPFVGREKASDIVERKAYDLFLGCRKYRSYGITAKYAAYRINRAIKNQGQSILNGKDISLYVAHPTYIKQPIIFDPAKKREELFGALALIDQIFQEADQKARFSIEVRFILPLPILRFDEFEGGEDQALMYTFENIGPDQARLPDAALYPKGSHWYELTHEAMASYDNQTLLKWRSAQRPEYCQVIGDALEPVPDFTSKCSLVDLLVRHLKINAGEVAKAKTQFQKDFVDPMDAANFKGP